MRWSTLLFLFLAGAQPSAQTPTSVFGYVQAGKFHPLLVVEDAQIGPYDAAKTSLLGVLRNAFEPTGAEFPVQKQIDYVDPSSDQPERFGVVPGRSDEKSFFELNRGRNPRAASVPTLELQRSFLRFLAHDGWGEQFLEDAEPGDEVATLERKGDVRILYVTDLDSDGKKELWIAYRLPYGKTGRMVWEQRAAEGEWVALVNHCFGCD